MNEEEIPVFGDGTTQRDYTYIEDIIRGVVGAIYFDKSMYEVINLGSNHPISLSAMIQDIEDVLGIKAKINRLPMQPGDVPQTYADIQKANELLDYSPSISFKEGVQRFVDSLNG